MSAQEIVIVETTTCRLSPQVRLGVGNIWEEDDERGATAGLWVLPPRGAATQTVRVTAGQQVAVPGYTLTILEVMLRGRSPRGALRLAVEPALS